MAPRRSTRLTAAQKQVNAASAQDEDSEPELAPKPRRKRARAQPDDADAAAAGTVTKRATKSRSTLRGKLHRLNEMPLEILHQIFGFVRPLDLLRLARTTKTLRKLLISREARLTWIDALSTIAGLPPCPEDLTEPAYVRLAFEHVCHLCGVGGVTNVMWNLRMRACSKCVESEKLVFAHRYSPITRELQENVEVDLDGLVSWDHGSGQKRDTSYCLVSSLRQVVADLAALDTSSESAVEDYKLARRKEIKARIEHTNNCWLWLEAYLDDRKEDLEQARRRRLLSIEVRVEEDLGYGKELRWLLHSDKSSGLREKLRDDFTGMKAVKQAKDLTDRMWSNMRADILTFFKEIRPTRIRSERFELLCDRIGTLAKLLPVQPLEGVGFLPRVRDLHRLPAFAAILDRGLAPDTEPPSEDLVTADDWADLLAALPEHAATLRREREAELLALLPERAVALHLEREAELLELLVAPAAPAAADWPSPLALATSLFTCSSCPHWRKTVLGCEEAMRHQCLTKYLPWYTRNEGREIAIDDPHKRVVTACDFVDESGGAGEFHFHTAASQAAERLVRLLDLDPATTTCAELDALDPLFWCSCYRCCKEAGRFAQKRVLHWRHVVAHMSNAPIERLSAADEQRERASAAVGDEDDLRGSDKVRDGKLWPNRACAHCRYRGFNIGHLGLRRHLSTKHQVSDPQPETDYILSPDAFIRRAPVWLNTFTAYSFSSLFMEPLDVLSLWDYESSDSDYSDF